MKKIRVQWVTNHLNKREKYSTVELFVYLFLVPIYLSFYSCPPATGPYPPTLGAFALYKYLYSFYNKIIIVLLVNTTRDILYKAMKLICSCSGNVLPPIVQVFVCVYVWLVVCEKDCEGWEPMSCVEPLSRGQV